MTIWEHFTNIFNNLFQSSSESVDSVKSISTRINTKSQDLVDMIEKEITEDVESWECKRPNRYSDCWIFKCQSRGLQVGETELGSAGYEHLLNIHAAAVELTRARTKEKALDMIHGRMKNPIYPYKVGSMYSVPEGHGYRVSHANPGAVAKLFAGDLFVVSDGKRKAYDQISLSVIHKGEKYILRIGDWDTKPTLVSDEEATKGHVEVLKGFANA